MRVAVYNQMFGMNGQNLFSLLKGHWLVHFQRFRRERNVKANLEKTVEILKESNADVVGISEVLEGQEEKLTERLKRLGYDYVFFEKGHKTRFRDLYVEVAIASKILCEKIEVKGFPVKNEMGGGGGFVHCYFPGLGTDVINLHLASGKKSVHVQQLDFVEQCVSGLSERVVVLGDFNVSHKVLEKRFNGFDLVSERVKTCPTTFGLRFLSSDLDHIFVRGYEAEGYGSLDGYSDHKLVWADLKEI